MKNENAGKLRALKKERLYSERAFVRHCIFDYHKNRKLDDIDESFLRAAETDGFLEPLLRIKENVRQEDGSQRETLVNYYSPHQIFIITELHNNKVGSDGKLVSKNSFDVRYGNRETGRAITWGWQGITFEIEHYKPSRKEANIFELCKDFRNFLRLLHSLEESRYTSFDTRKERHLNDAPSLYFDYSPLKDNPAILVRYNLSIEKLKVLRANVGHASTQIDPLEYWYYYIHRHPQWRKDLLKEKGLLAQELYIICDLISDVIETITGEKQPPLLELLHPDFHPYLMSKTEYAEGNDIKSLWEAVRQFKEWAKKIGNQNLVKDTTLTRLTDFETELRDYESRYGDRSYLTGVSREVVLEGKLTIEDLDPKSKNMVKQMIDQGASKEDIKSEITTAIDFHLSDLGRELWGILDETGEIIRQKVGEAWRKREGAHGYTADEKIHNHLQDEAESWSAKKKEFDEIPWTTRLVFCSKCREKPVRLHHNYSDRQISARPLCDDCFEKIGKRVLVMNAEDWKQVKEGEWQCDCFIEGTDKHPTLYKFAHRNTISLWTKNSVPIKVELAYGKAILEAKCNNCGRVQRKELDWGWND